MNRFTRRAVTVMLVAVPVALTACGAVSDTANEKMAEKMIEESIGGNADVRIDENGESVTITDENGTYTYNAGGSTGVPAEFPTNVPTPSGDPISAYASGDEFNLGYSVEDWEKAAADYSAALESAGFTVGYEATTGSMVTRSFAGSSHNVTVIAGDQGVDGKGYLSVVVTPL
jgi:hypothetical protein